MCFSNAPQVPEKREVGVELALFLSPVTGQPFREPRLSLGLSAILVPRLPQALTPNPLPKRAVLLRGPICWPPGFLPSCSASHTARAGRQEADGS